MKNHIDELKQKDIPTSSQIWPAYCVRLVGKHHGWLGRVTFSFVLETDKLTFHHSSHWPDLELTLNSLRNMSLVPAELRLSFTSAIVHAVT